MIVVLQRWPADRLDGDSSWYWRHQAVRQCVRRRSVCHRTGTCSTCSFLFLSQISL